ncbi:MAG: MetQ/NlpA family ABC transporter substrate-binding protein [Clostridiales bacterium]|nr:MetQ/NlpA family ABC transporter substrate-binding protein [Clostridiales bacterium]
MKRKLSLAALLMASVLAFTACGGSKASTDETADADTQAEETDETAGEDETGELVTLKVGATAVPHAEILNEVVDDLAEEGIDLQVVEFSDYTLINKALVEGEVDANYFQHQPYLDEFIAESGADLVSAAGIHIEPMGIYSESIVSLDELKEGDKVGVPNDATNEGRALLLLQSEGLITLASDSLTQTPADIVENNLGLEFVELAAEQLPRTLSETTISVINTNYALEGGLSPSEDAIAMEAGDSPYVNIVAVRAEDADSENIAKLVDALTSDEVRTFINEQYNGEVVPVF